MELGPVAHHQHDALAGPQPRRRQPAGDPGDLVAHLPVRRLVPVARAVAGHAPQGDDVRVGGRRAQERLRERVAATAALISAVSAA